MNLQKLYLRVLAFPLASLLYIGGWKKSVLGENRQRCGLRDPFYRPRFCAHVALDFLRLAHGRYGQIIRIRPRDAEKLKKLKSCSCLYLTAHFHNWELMGSWMTAQGIRLLSAARPMSRPFAQRLLMGMRTRLGLATVTDGIPRSAIRHLDQGGCFGMLWDQRTSDSSVRAAFFGELLAVDPLPLFLIRHRPVPVWFGALLPDGTLRLILLASPAAPPSVTLTPSRLARRYHRVLEVLIRQHPSWWYGMAHRRFLESGPLHQISPKLSLSTSGFASAMQSNSGATLQIHCRCFT